MPDRRPPSHISIPLAALAVSVASVAAAQGIVAIVVAAEGRFDWWHQALAGGVLSFFAATVLLLTWLRLPVVATIQVARMLRLAVFITAASLLLNGVAALVAIG